MTATHSHRQGWYLAANTVFSLLVVVAALTIGNANPRVAYLCMLFAICTSVILYADAPNGRYAILCVFMPLYFFFYGAADLLGVFGLPPLTNSTGILSIPEITILLGAALLVGGYRLGVSARGNEGSRFVKDWPGRTVVSVALLLWAFGIVSTWIWQTDSAFAFRDPERQPSAVETIALLIGRYSQILALALLTYRFAESKSKAMLFLMLAIFAIEFVFGFFADSKELAIRAPTLAIVAMYLVNRKVPKGWILAVGAVVFLSFPIFQAYRTAVLGGYGLTAGQAAENMLDNLKLALDFHRNETENAKVDAVSSRGSLSLLSRTALKPTMELIMEKVGDEVPYQHGYTIGLVATGFVPRLFWPSKPDSSVGQLFNREFQISEDKNTYISATHLGELYWNFGWAGVIVGMTLIGYLLGFVGAKVDLSRERSVARFLILVMTIYLVCLRFEGGIALQYIQWIRSLAIVWILDLLFARLREARGLAKIRNTEGRPAAPKLFPNLLR